MSVSSIFRKNVFMHTKRTFFSGTVVQDGNKKSRKRKRDNEEDSWAEVLSNIVSNLKTNSQLLSSSDCSADVSSNGSVLNAELRYESSYTFEKYDAVRVTYMFVISNYFLSSYLCIFTLFE